MTSLHPGPAGTDTRAADRPDGATPPVVLPGSELLASLLAGTDTDEQPVTHVHHLAVRESQTRPTDPVKLPAPFRV